MVQVVGERVVLGQAQQIALLHIEHVIQLREVGRHPKWPVAEESCACDDEQPIQSKAMNFVKTKKIQFNYFLGNDDTPTASLTPQPHTVAGRIDAILAV